MSRFVEIEPWLPALRRFAQALAARRGEAAEATRARADWIIHRSVNSALNEAASCDTGHLRILLFAAAIQHHRAQLRREKFDNGQEPLRGGSFAEAAASPLVAAEAMAAQAALAQLPVESREVLLLVALAQFPYVQAAQALDLSLGETFARLTRARVTLGGLLDHQEREAAQGAMRVVGGHGVGGKGGRRPGAQHLRLVK